MKIKDMNNDQLREILSESQNELLSRQDANANKKSETHTEAIIQSLTNEKKIIDLLERILAQLTDGEK